MSDFDKLRALAERRNNTVSGEVNQILREYLSTLDENFEEKGTERELELQSQVRLLKGKLEAEQAKQTQILSIYSKRQNLLLERIEQLDPNFDRHQFVREVRM